MLWDERSYELSLSQTGAFQLLGNERYIRRLLRTVQRKCPRCGFAMATVKLGHYSSGRELDAARALEIGAAFPDEPSVSVGEGLDDGKI